MLVGCNCNSYFESNKGEVIAVRISRNTETKYFVKVRYTYDYNGTAHSSIMMFHTNEQFYVGDSIKIVKK